MAKKSITSSVDASSIGTDNNDDVMWTNASRNKLDILRYNSESIEECVTMRTNYKIFDDMRMDSIMSQPSKKKKKRKETKKETQLRPFESKMLRVNRMI